MLNNEIYRTITIALLSYAAVIVSGCAYQYQPQSTDSTIIFGDQNKDPSNPGRNFFINLDPDHDSECNGFKRIGASMSNEHISFSRTKTVKVPALTTIGIKAWALERDTVGFVAAARECSAPVVLFTPDANSKYSVDMQFNRSKNSRSISCKINIQQISDDGTRTNIENLKPLPRCGNESSFHF